MIRKLSGAIFSNQTIYIRVRFFPVHSTSPLENPGLCVKRPFAAAATRVVAAV